MTSPAIRPRPTPSRRPANVLAATTADSFLDLTMSQVNGLRAAAKAGLAPPISIGVDQDRVKGLLPFHDVLAWGQLLFTQPRVAYPTRDPRGGEFPDDGYIQVSGEYGGSRWELGANVEACTPGQLCRRCAGVAAAEQAARAAKLDELLGTTGPIQVTS
jgi:hypothetical protein